MKDLRQRLLATFQVEHNEHVKHIRESLAAFEASGVAPVGPDLDEVFRRAHSLKGAARAVNLRSIETLAHRLETLFSRMREGALQLDQSIAKVINQVLDASEDALAAFGAGPEAPPPAEAIAAIEAVLGSQGSLGSVGSLGSQSPKGSHSSQSAPNPVTRENPANLGNPGNLANPGNLGNPGNPETLRLNAESLDRIMSSAGELLTESLRQNNVTRQLRLVSSQLSEAASERDRVRKSGDRVFQKMDTTPELAAAARYVNYLDHQVHVLSKQVDTAMRLQERNAWTLKSLAGELQRDVRQARMIPAENVFDGFRKMVRDLAKDAGKTIELHMTGLQVEADRIVLQALKDPVMHMLRNAVSHGLEPETERKSKGKPAEGRIDLAIAVRGNQLTIAIEDDGRGVDVGRVAEIAIRKGLMTEADRASRSQEELMRLILLPGFSTARAVTELSGRGMGLSVVAQAVAQLQGKVDIAAGKKGGTRLSISAPLSVASHRLLLVECQSRTFAIPLHGIERLRRIPLADVQTVEAKPVVKIEGQLVPVVSLAHLLNAAEPKVSVTENTLCVMVMQAGNKRLAVAVDAFLSERDAIIKDLPAPANRNTQIAGGILLEDGSVCLVLNSSELMEGFQQTATGLVLSTERRAPDAAKRSLEILVVDDSMTTRTLEKSVLEAHGYQVAIAVDGVDALNYLRAQPVGLVISDLQMPRLDGFGLLEEIKRDPQLKHTPVIIVSSVESPEEQARGLTLGADAYIVKRKFDQQELLETIRQIL